MLANLIILVTISSVCTAPLQYQLFQPLLQQSLQQQLRELQQLQMLQKLNSLQYHNQNFPRPLLILLPKIPGSNEETEYKHKISLKHSDSNAHQGYLDKDRDSVIIDAETKPEEGTRKAILLIPNEGRFSIGDFISSIPFLPIEINVPDSISWIYDGISSIISGIGQRLPFRPQMTDTMQSSEQGEVSLRIKPNHNMRTPILLIPLGQTF